MHPPQGAVKSTRGAAAQFVKILSVKAVLQVQLETLFLEEGQKVSALLSTAGRTAAGAGTSAASRFCIVV